MQFPSDFVDLLLLHFFKFIEGRYPTYQYNSQGKVDDVREKDKDCLQKREGNSLLFVIIESMQQSSFDEQEEEEIFEDDLAQYQQQIEEKICNEVMNFKGVVEDDAQQLQKNDSGQQVQQRKQLTEAERQARDLKLKNARKYFEVVKLTYIKEVNAAMKESQFVEKNHKEVVFRFLSQLSKQLIQQYQRLKKQQPLSVKLQQLIIFLKNARDFIAQQNPQNMENSSTVFWSICESFKLACRKIFFFDLGSLVQETFYKLNYHHLQKMLKKEARRAKEYQLMKIEIDLKKEQEQKKEGRDYLHFQDFQFDINSFQKSRTSNKSRLSRASTISQQSQQSQPQPQSQSNSLHLKARRESNFLRKRNYKWAYFHIFSPVQQKWKLVNSQILQFQQQSQCKSFLLSAKPIIGFYSFRILHFKPPFSPLSPLRLFQRLLHEDLTMYFLDNVKNLTMRRKRVGVKFVMRDLFQRGSFNKHRFMLQEYDQYVMQKNDSIELQFQLTNFPKNKQEMLNSQYFIIPSLLPQYSILDPKALPIDKEFNEEKVYLKRDLIPATSKMVWIDRGRRVKKDQIPVKKTENKSKNMSQLFLYQQTEPFYLAVNQQTGNFIPDDQYNSIYIPPDYHFDHKFSVISKSIAGICNKHNFRYVRLVQGFIHTMGRILPNYIGFLVYRQDQQRILGLWQQRQQLLMGNKQKNRQRLLISLWNKLFTKIQLSEWSHNFPSS